MNSSECSRNMPLAELLRPTQLDDVLGQEILMKSESPHQKYKESPPRVGSLRGLIESQSLPSIVLWGPPGSGKTSIARIIASHYTDAIFINISAVSSGIQEIKKHCAEAQLNQHKGVKTIMFIDEIHRFNKTQQDSLLHFVEEGTIILIGASTENPSFEINSALLSRLRVFVLHSLSHESLLNIFARAEQFLDHKFDIEARAKEMLLQNAMGDARRLLNTLEELYNFQRREGHTITADLLKGMSFYNPVLYDKAGDQHYNLISALHKSIRGSDCDAALYWYSRMIEGGEDPRYIARRLLRLSYEDIGLADPKVSEYVLHAWESFERLGSPEGEIALASAVLYLALSPKSNSVYSASKEARNMAKRNSTYHPPLHILNAPTGLMKKLKYGEEYQYDHDYADAFSGQNYFPKEMSRLQFYIPQERGFEREMKKRIEYFNSLRKKINNSQN